MSRVHSLVEREISDRPHYKTVWTCEKWSEEAVAFCQRRLGRLGVEEINGPLVTERTQSKREKFASILLGRDVFTTVTKPSLIPVSKGVTSHVLRQMVGKPEELVEIEGNLLLNEGIQRLIDLAIAAVSNQTAANAWTNTTSYIGVGDTTTAEAATQTELAATAAATNRFYKVMNATFPSRTNQTVTFQADFTSAEGNFVWNEWTVSSGATTASTTGFLVGTINLNRKVAALGTKSTGTWTLSAAITFS